MLRVIGRETIDEAVRRLLAAAPAGSRVILFGSYARGQADPGSDLDFLVVEPEVEDTFAEEVRLINALRPMRLAADVVVLGRDEFEYWKDTPNTLAYEALKEGERHGPVA
jgi:predicted nucleotidyltransferase